MNGADLAASLQLLREIGQATIAPDAFDVANAIWSRDLDGANPLWQYLSAETLVVDDERGQAHAIAFTDTRLGGMGFVGYLGCTTVAAGANVLLQARRSLNVPMIYGPVNGTITRDYRLSAHDDVLFSGEPVSVQVHRDAFEQAGFVVYNRYMTGEADKSGMHNYMLRSDPMDLRYSVRAFGEQDPQEDLRQYHELMNVIFSVQSVYCPAISFEERSYNFGSPPFFDPDYSFFVDAAGTRNPIGFVVAYPHDNHLVFKTAGVLNEYRKSFVFSDMVRIVHERALDAGLDHAYYGIVRAGNAVSGMLRPGTEIARRYFTMCAPPLQTS